MSFPQPSSLPEPPDGDQRKNVVINAITLWTNLMALAFVVLRVVTRTLLVKKSLWWDDWFIILAMASTAIGGALDACEVHFGFGRHAYYLTDHDLRYFTAYAYGEWIQTFLTLMCTKVSICFFLLRIPFTKKLIRPLHISIAILILSNIVITLIWILHCLPPAAMWDRSVSGHCMSRRSLLNLIFSQAIISVVSDFAFALYPIVILWSMKINMKDKIGVIILMGLGIIVGSCCIVRTVLNDQSLPIDATYGGITNWFWRTFEVQLGIICACMPAVAQFYKQIQARMYADQRRPSVLSRMRNWPGSRSLGSGSKARSNSGTKKEDSTKKIPLVSRTPRRFERALLGRRAQYLLSTNGMDLEASRFDNAEHFGVISPNGSEVPINKSLRRSSSTEAKNRTVEFVMPFAGTRSDAGGESSTHSLDRQASREPLRDDYGIDPKHQI